MIILKIYKKFLDKILSGEKEYEFRKDTKRLRNKLVLENMKIDEDLSDAFLLFKVKETGEEYKIGVYAVYDKNAEGEPISISNQNYLAFDLSDEIEKIS